jgi:hypothetical protein
MPSKSPHSDRDPDRVPRRYQPVLRRNTQLTRQLTLLKMLLSGRPSLSEMARALRVHKRTVRRDLEGLEELHLAIVRERVWLDDGSTRVSLERCPICSTQAKRAPFARLDDDDHYWGPPTGRTMHVEHGGTR